MTHYWYTINLPLEYRRFHRACSRGNRLSGYYWALCQEALYTPGYPYYVTVLVLAPKFEELYHLPALVKRNPELWDEHHAIIVPRQTSVPSSKDKLYKPWQYEKYCRARESLDSTVCLRAADGEYHFPSHDGKTGWCDLFKYRSYLDDGAWRLRLDEHSSVSQAGPTGDAIVESNPEKRTALVRALPRGEVQQAVLLSFFCSAGNDDDLCLVTRSLVAYFRAAPKPMPVYTDMAMALFVSRGYEFNDKTGTYTLNKAGELLLDYVVEHVRQNVMGHLAILHERGCSEFLDRLIGKHHPELGTWERFNESFTKTPTTQDQP